MGEADGLEVVFLVRIFVDEAEGLEVGFLASLGSWWGFSWGISQGISWLMSWNQVGAAVG